MSVDLVNILAFSILTLSLSLSLVRVFSLNSNNLWEGHLARPRSVPQSAATASRFAPPQPPTYAVQPKLSSREGCNRPSTSMATDMCPRSSREGCNRPSMSMAGSVSPGFWKNKSLWNAKLSRVARGGFGAKAPRLAARPILIYFAILIYCAG